MQLKLATQKKKCLKIVAYAMPKKVDIKKNPVLVVLLGLNEWTRGLDL